MDLLDLLQNSIIDKNSKLGEKFFGIYTMLLSTLSNFRCGNNVFSNLIKGS
jgi:hypothetical protein